MLTSKQLIELTGISRATLNNYVALGILPSPVIKTPSGGKGEGRATRLGYFPDESIDRIKKVQEMKKEGISIADIASQLATKSGGDHPLNEPPPQPSSSSIGRKASQGREPLSSFSMAITIENFPGPAYMVNNNFELIWWNDQAVTSIFDCNIEMTADLHSRNLLSLLVEGFGDTELQDMISLLQPHLAAAKKRLTQQSLIKIYSSLVGEELSLIESLYQGARPIGKEPIVQFPISITDENGKQVLCDLYVCFYREGILFTYNPIEEDENFLLNFLTQRNQVIRELLRNRKPYLSHVGVMVADLQNSVRLCAELPAEEYFELINNIWQESEPIFRKYYGTHGKHAGDGMVYYFFPQPDCNYIFNAVQCAADLEHMMKRITQKWQARKGWFNELQLNIGLNEGQEWFGTYHAGAHVEFAVLGETINYAARISDFARDGTIWITKSMLTQLPIEYRRTINYGIPRHFDEHDHIFVSDTYANVASMLDPDNPMNPKFRDIEMIPVTQIRGVNAAILKE